MADWLQNLLVLTLAAVCAAVVAYQGVQALRGRAGSLGCGSCKGCGSAHPAPDRRIVFLPVESLGRRSRR